MKQVQAVKIKTKRDLDKNWVNKDFRTFSKMRKHRSYPFLLSCIFAGFIGLMVTCGPPPGSSTSVDKSTPIEQGDTSQTPSTINPLPIPSPMDSSSALRDSMEGPESADEVLQPPPPPTDFNFLPGSKEDAELSIRTRKGLLNGSLAYRIPDSMHVGELSRASVLVSMKLDASRNEMTLQATKLASIDGSSSVQDTAKVVFESIRVGTQMQARISDPHQSLEENFIITPLGDSIQSLTVDEDSSAFWQWDITPLRDGQFPINLHLEVKLAEGMRTIPVFTRTIYVESEPNWLVLAGGIGLGVVVLGLSLFFYRNRRTASGVKKREYLEEKDVELIRFHIREAELDLAMDEMEKRIHNLSPGLRKHLDIQYQDYTEIKKLRQAGMETQENFNLIQNRVSAALLDMVSDLEAHAPTP